MYTVGRICKTTTVPRPRKCPTQHPREINTPKTRLRTYGFPLLIFCPDRKQTPAIVSQGFAF